MILNAHSWFSFKYGVLSPEDVLKQAQADGHRVVALTDINCSAGHSDFFRHAKEYGVRPVAGIDLRHGIRRYFTGLARNMDGLHQLNGLLTDHLLDGASLPAQAPELPDAIIIYPFGGSNIPDRLRANEFIGVLPGDVNRLRFARRTHPQEKYVALTAATFRSKADHNTHRLLRAMHHNTLHTKLADADLAPPDELFLSASAIEAAYADVPELLKRTQALLEQCEVDFEFDRSKNRRTWSGDPEGDRQLLHQLANDGLRYRYGSPGPKEIQRLEHELRTIEGKDFVSYFLINWDLVKFAKENGFFHVGRGSGANSLVAYCIGITDVDPIELDLYFERFINPARDKPPDFDIDFSWKDRDHITRRLFEKYGEGRRVALLATYSTFQRRAIMHELGKVFGLPPYEVAALSDGDPSKPRWIGKGDSLQFGSRPQAPVAEDPIVRAIHRYGRRIEGMPSHLSIHVGGVLVSERPVTYYTALHMPPKGFPTTQFSMVEAEDLGLYKFDILSQRGLGHIRDAVELVERNTGKRIDIHDTKQFKEDPVIKQMLRTGDTIGCFYVESPAMRMLMKKMQVEDYLGLVAASSIIRPGVANSGMMREYLMRYHDPERRKLAPPKLLEIMPETFGVMVYQEDVIKVGYLYAGLTLTEADTLRRSMSGKFRNRKEFSEVRESFFNGAIANGHPLAEIEELWQQIVSFGDFSFAKGHSASYAVESYMSLYLKAHHPLEFLVGVANNFGGFYHTEFYLHEAKRAGAVIEAPCVNVSEELCSLVNGEWSIVNGRKRSEWSSVNGEWINAGFGISPVTSHYSPFTNNHSLFTNDQSPTKPRIYLGLGNIKGLPEEAIGLILNERRRHGPFADLPDLLRRVPLHVEQARVLVRVGALRFTGRTKVQLLWDLAMMHHGAADACTDGDLFIAKVQEPRLPELEQHPLADAYDELELLGFPLCDPFLLVERGEWKGGSEWSSVNGEWKNAGSSSHQSPVPNHQSPNSPPMILAEQMPAYIGKRVTMLGYMIHVKATHTHTGRDMTFGSFIDTAGDFWDSTQFPQIAERFPFRGRGVYVLTGVIEEEFGHCALRTQHMEKLPWKADPRYGEK